MRLNSTLVIAASLVTMSLIPQAIATYQLINNGGLDWPMNWTNEANVWGAIFSLLALLGIIVAIKNKKQTPIGSTIVTLFASLIIIVSTYSLVSSGSGPASKGDSEALQLIAFWSSGWWE